MGKFCFFCGSKKVIKKGLKLGRQRWLCKDCGRLFSSNFRTNTAQVVDLYAQGNLTIRQIAGVLEVNEKTIYRHLAKYKHCNKKTRLPDKIIAMMDATYWGWNFGVVAIKDHISGDVVWSKFINRKERIEDYAEGVRALEKEGCEIICIVRRPEGLERAACRLPFPILSVSSAADDKT